MTTAPDKQPRKNKGSSYSDLVCDHVRQSILKGDLRPGDRLREKDLEKALGISRTPIREAMKSLEAQGLIKMESWKGAFIAVLTRRQIIELYDFRTMIEDFSVRMVCAQASDQDIDRLDDIVSRSETLTSASQSELVRLNSEFHAALTQFSRNRFVEEAIGPLRISFALMKGNAYGETGQWAQILREHRAIVDAIRARDAERAAALVREHIFQSGVARLKRLQDADTL
ncbi:MAG: GntR family transcriptional regulator [Pseudomonadota bacterium]